MRTTFIALASLVCIQPLIAQSHRAFTVADEIGLAQFSDGNTVYASPDGKMAAVLAERGLLQEDRVQDEMRIYNLQDLRSIANDAGTPVEPAPLWDIRESTYKQGPILSQLRWLPDSTGLAFLQRTDAGNNRLCVAEIGRKRLTCVTPTDQNVLAFDMLDPGHFAYVVRNAGRTVEMMNKVPAFAATGLSLYGGLVESARDLSSLVASNRGELWAARGGRPFQVRNSKTGSAIPLYSPFQVLRLAPNGNLVAVTQPVEQIPKEWEARFPPPRGREGLGLMAGKQDLDAALTYRYATVYAIVDIRTRTLVEMPQVPTAFSAAWPAAGNVAWSADSQALALPGIFLPDRSGSAPCVALAVPAAASLQCVQQIKTEQEESIRGVRFAPGGADRLIVEYRPAGPSAGIPTKERILTRNRKGIWEVQAESPNSVASQSEVTLAVKQGLNAPPVLSVTDRGTGRSRVIWNPNPQVNDFKLGEASIYRWKDETGRDWTGGLYKPPDYQPGTRYPLVIQTHGFPGDQFRPSGIFTTAFAARALAVQEILVLQVSQCPNLDTPDEGPCQVRGYESAVRHLAADGVIDQDRLGIIGFSRSCFHVMEELTKGSVHFRAASITDGLNQGYLQYLLEVDGAQNIYEREAESIIGAPPYGAGLQSWLKNSPEFNLDRISTPLQVVAHRGLTAVFMWEPYAMLRMMKKPVDLVILNTNEHTLTNPEMRMASQGGTVDWFRFWLQGYEDPEPAKKQQYTRWEELRRIQDAQSVRALFDAFLSAL